MGREREKGGRRPPLLVQFGPGGRRRAAHLWLPPSFSTKAHGGTPVLPGNFPELFRCPNNMVQYINLYVSIISRLLIMSVISSGTPNNLRYIKSHNS